jgi:hypothetical protein
MSTSREPRRSQARSDAAQIGAPGFEPPTSCSQRSAEGWKGVCPGTPDAQKALQIRQISSYRCGRAMSPENELMYPFVPHERAWPWVSGWDRVSLGDRESIRHLITSDADPTPCGPRPTDATAERVGTVARTRLPRTRWRPCGADRSRLARRRRSAGRWRIRSAP